MTLAQDYLARCEEAERQAARCVDGSQQQREFREVAGQWRVLAERAAPRKPLPHPPL